MTSAIAIPAQAQSQVWDGSESSDWRDGDNWVSGSAPAVQDYALGSNGTPNPLAPLANMPTIDGGSLTIGNALIGYSHAQGGITLTISNGATFATTDVVVGEGNNAMAPADRATQSGAVNLRDGSTWNTTGLTIGNYGDGIVNITGASKVTAGALTLGSNRTPPDVASGRLTISGAGSAMTVTSSSALIGNSGEGTVRVETGGKLTTSSLALGINAQSAGTVTVTGPGSHWVRTAGTLNIGQSGAGTVEVTNGGGVSTLHGSSAKVSLALFAGSSGSLSVTGSGSRFEAGQIWAGQQSAATVSATAGGEINATYLLLGTTATGTGTAILSGPGSLINSSTYTSVGYAGQGSLTVSNAATLRAPLVHIAQDALGAGSTGTLNIGAAAVDSAAVAGTVDAAEVRFGAGNGILVFNHTGTDFTFAPKLTGGNGTVRQMAGTTTLTGDSATFAGMTQIEGGLLRVSGILGGNVNVASGATLAGNGKVGTTQVNSGATIAPDGTLNVAGNLTFASGSTYKVDASSSTGSDLIAATGTITINGGAVNHQASGGTFAWETPHKIVSADTLLTGTFDTISTQMAFLDATLDYSKPNEVWLTLKRNDIGFSSVANSANQQGVGRVLSNLPTNHPLVEALMVLTQSQAQDALDQLSGDTHSTLQGANIELSNQVAELTSNRMRQSFDALGQGNDAVSSYLPTGLDAGDDDMPITIWAQGLGEYARVAPNGSAGGLTSGSGGVLGGADVLLPSNWRIGVLGGYTGSGFSAIDRQATGSAQNLHAGIYAGAELDAVRLQANALLTWHGLSTKRDVAFGGLTDTLTASYGAQTIQLFGEAGYAFDLGSVDIEPFGSLAYALNHTDGYTETGGFAALTSLASSNDAAFTVLGARMAAPFAAGDTLLMARGMLGWQHQSGTAPSSQIALAGSAPFTVTGASFSGDALVYEAGLNIDLNGGLNLDLLYGGRISAGDVSHSIKGIVGASF